ncbi:MAG: hypothetical protein N838_14775 [Thiohalocapsa sp. PB-PSB1]|jgi:hypothetical protein|nr:MAG: hypothetical protein N838_14775 [Thiohalocapsa sp. PB-PSB1]
MASPFLSARPDPGISAEIRREFPLEYAEPEFELADIVRLYGDDYRAAHTPSFEQGRALHAIEVCRTTALGAHIDQCDQCGHFEIAYNSCRNRHCPKCRAAQRAACLDEASAREARRLDLGPDAYRAPDEPDLDDDAAWKNLMQQLHQQDWVVHIEAPFADPEPLIRYLGRYVNRIAIANHRIEAIDGGRVTFRYRDNRIKDPHAPEAEKRMTLSGADFIHRFLQHVLPPSFHRIRYYGLLGGSRRRQNLTRCRECLGLADPETPYIPDMDAFLAKQARDPSLCPVCGKGHLHNILHVFSFQAPPAPFNAPPPSRAPPLPAPAALPEAA